MLVTDLIHWENHQHNEKSRQHNDSFTNISNQSHQHHCHQRLFDDKVVSWRQSRPIAETDLKSFKVRGRRMRGQEQMETKNDDH